MKSETATAERNKSIPDPGHFTVTLWDGDWALFRKRKELSPVFQTCCRPFKSTAWISKKHPSSPDFGKRERRIRDALLPFRQNPSVQYGIIIQHFLLDHSYWDFSLKSKGTTSCFILDWAASETRVVQSLGGRMLPLSSLHKIILTIIRSFLKKRKKKEEITFLGDF